jgi:hypothetical protein
VSSTTNAEGAIDRMRAWPFAAHAVTAELAAVKGDVVVRIEDTLKNVLPKPELGRPARARRRQRRTDLIRIKSEPGAR